MPIWTRSRPARRARGYRSLHGNVSRAGASLRLTSSAPAPPAAMRARTLPRSRLPTRPPSELRDADGSEARCPPTTSRLPRAARKPTARCSPDADRQALGLGESRRARLPPLLADQRLRLLPRHARRALRKAGESRRGSTCSPLARGGAGIHRAGARALGWPRPDQGRRGRPARRRLRRGARAVQRAEIATWPSPSRHQRLEPPRVGFRATLAPGATSRPPRAVVGMAGADRLRAEELLRQEGAHQQVRPGQRPERQAVLGGGQHGRVEPFGAADREAGRPPALDPARRTARRSPRWTGRAPPRSSATSSAPSGSAARRAAPSRRRALRRGWRRGRLRRSP